MHALLNPLLNHTAWNQGVNEPWLWQEVVNNPVPQMFHKELHWDLPYKSVHEQVMSEAQADMRDRESPCLGMPWLTPEHVIPAREMPAGHSSGDSASQTLCGSGHVFGSLLCF